MKKVIVDYRITDLEKFNLIKLGYDVLICPPCFTLYDAVCGHPDMLINLIDNYNIVVHKNMEAAFIEVLKKLKLNVIYSETSLERLYPNNIYLNGVLIGDIFLHNLKYTDSSLIKALKNKRLINVKQGYTKCSTAVVSEKAIMTSDLGIIKALKNEKFDILYLPPGDILLPGLDYGFIGGCCGLIDKNLLAFYGSLDNYMYKNDVLSFLTKHKVDAVFLSNTKLVDRGSIFCLDV